MTRWAALASGSFPLARSVSAGEITRAEAVAELTGRAARAGLGDPYPGMPLADWAGLMIDLATPHDVRASGPRPCASCGTGLGMTTFPPPPGEPWPVLCPACRAAIKDRTGARR